MPGHTARHFLLSQGQFRVTVEIDQYRELAIWGTADDLESIDCCGSIACRMPAHRQAQTQLSILSQTEYQAKYPFLIRDGLKPRVSR